MIAPRQGRRRLVAVLILVHLWMVGAASAIHSCFTPPASGAAALQAAQPSGPAVVHDVARDQDPCLACELLKATGSVLLPAAEPPVAATPAPDLVTPGYLSPGRIAHFRLCGRAPPAA